jgi:sugar phosphate isomerase/epimerase
MTISLFSQSLFALDLKEAIEVTATSGYDAIELACCKPHFDLETARRDPEGVARRLERAGLSVSALSGFNSFTDPGTLDDELLAAETFIRLAPLFKTRTVKLNPGPPGSATATPAHWRCLERALATLVPLAREVGVRLAFETHMHQLSDTLTSAKRLLALAPADVVGLTVDFSNLVFAGEDVAQVVSDLNSRTYNTPGQITPSC